MDLLEAFKQFPNVARPIIIKSDVLRLGLGFSEAAREAFRNRNDINFKGYWLFSKDRGKPVTAGEKIPWVFIIEDGTEEGTVVQVRRYDASPYCIDIIDNSFMLSWKGEPLGKVHFDTPPRHYSRTIDGVPMMAVVQGFRDQLFVTANKYCEYTSLKQECLFCDLTAQAHTQKVAGEVMILRKQAAQAAEVLEVGFREPRFRHLTITGGAILTEYQGSTQVDWYCDFLNTIRERLKLWYPTAFQIGALDDEGWKKVHDTGVPTVEPNIEVWDKRLFEIICPGKAERIGYDEWIRRTIRAVDFWGPGNVNPNFVAGVEMASPFGFKEVDQALESTLGGFDFLMSHGVLPRQGNFWAVEANSKLAGTEPPPLEYYLRLGMGYLELREKHGFTTPIPPYCRTCLLHGTEYDFEYWHGSGPASRKAEQEDRGVPARKE